MSLWKHICIWVDFADFKVPFVYEMTWDKTECKRRYQRAKTCPNFQERV